MIVYVITHLASGKRYVGKTVKSLTQRWREHCLPTSKCTYIARAIRLHGAAAFSVAVLREVNSVVELNYYERFYIRELGTKAPHGYNLTDGGDGTAGYKPSSAERERRRRAMIGQKYALGHKVSAESRRVMSERAQARPSNRKGQHHSEVSRRRMSVAQLKRTPMSVETRRKLSEAGRGRVPSEETRRKLSIWQKGKKLSMEHRRKLSEAHKRRFAIKLEQI